MRPRVVLITGTSARRGIGYATARRLATVGTRCTRRCARWTRLRISPRTPVLGASRFGTSICPIGPRCDRCHVGAGGRLDAVVTNAGYGVIGGGEEVALDIAGGSVRA